MEPKPVQSAANVNTRQLALIDEYLDELKIPKQRFTTYGRVCLLGDKYKDLLQKLDTLNEDMRIELGIDLEE